MKFSVGQRVAVYGFDATGFEMRRSFGVIVKCETDYFPDSIGVLLDSEKRAVRVSPKQCRLLKKKERRRIWIVFGTNGRPVDYYVEKRPNPLPGLDVVEFFEVKKK
jgi:hypothetical protein